MCNKLNKIYKTIAYSTAVIPKTNIESISIPKLIDMNGSGSNRCCIYYVEFPMWNAEQDSVLSKSSAITRE